jgi:hypothetical protein
MTSKKSLSTIAGSDIELSRRGKFTDRTPGEPSPLHGYTAKAPETSPSV